MTGVDKPRKVIQMSNSGIRIIYILCTLFFAIIVVTGCETPSPSTSPPKNTVISADQTLIHYDLKGSNTATLLFIHCWSCDRSYWNNQFDLFSKYFRVVRLDLAGHGESTSHRTDYTIQKFATDVETVIDQLGLTNVILIGHSMGGPVAVQTALEIPDKITGVIAVDSFETGFTWPKTDQEIEKFLKPFKTNFSTTTENMVRSMFKPATDPQLVNKIAEHMSSAPTTIAVSALRETMKWMINYPEHLQKLRVPLYHINANPKSQAKGTTNDKIIHINNVGHFIPQVTSASFNGALEQTVAKILGL